jgi:hypothetical protein
MVESPKMSLTSESPATVESRAARCFERSVICSPGADRGRGAPSPSADVARECSAPVQRLQG